MVDEPVTAVVDTNVVVAGLLTSNRRSPTARILDAMLSGRLIFLLSEELLAEYRRVLLRPGIRERHGLGEEEIDRILLELARQGVVRAPRVEAGSETDSESDSGPGPGSDWGPDSDTGLVPGDGHLLDLAATRRGTILVTGDAALMAGAPAELRVQSPADFFDSAGH